MTHKCKNTVLRKECFADLQEVIQMFIDEQKRKLEERDRLLREKDEEIRKLKARVAELEGR